jgi:hypothetical protein
MIAELMPPIENAADPVRLHAFFVQGLIDAGLIGAKRAAALQDQSDTVASVGPPSVFNCNLGVGRTRVHDVSSEFPDKICSLEFR